MSNKLHKGIIVLISVVFFGSLAYAQWELQSTIEQGGTGSSEFSPNGVIVSGPTSVSPLTASSSPTVGYLTATSTTATSTFAGGLNVAGTSGLTVLQNGNVGVGTASPSEQLELTGSIELPDTTNANQYGVIYKDGSTFLHNFSYGDNGVVTTRGYNTFLGKDAGNLTLGLTADDVNESSYNTGIGQSALKSLTTGGKNTALGYNAGLGVTTGSDNTFVGFSAGQNMTTGGANMFLGRNAGMYSNGSANVSIGYNSLVYNAIGSNNVVMGRDSGFGVLNQSTFSNSTLVGYQTGYSLTTGGNNILLGYKAGDNLTTGSNNLVIGYDIDAPSATASNQLSIGNLIFGTGVDGTGTTVSSGKVGIKTNNPVSNLEINDTIANANFLTFSKSSIKSGNIGVIPGETGTFSVNYDLGGQRAYQIFDGTTNVAIRYYNGLTGIGDTTGDAVLEVSNSGGATTPFMVSSNDNNDGDYVIVTSSGNVGIGTTSPFAKLSVKGAGSTTGVNFQTTNSSDSPLFTILDSGNVGVGTTNPDYKITVNGLTANSAISSQSGYNIDLVDEPTSGSLALIETAGNVDEGLHYYKVTYTTALGETRPYTIGSITTDATHKQVTVTIPVSSDPRVTGRKLYRTKAGGASFQEYYLDAVANNTATTYTDNVADSSLTGAVYGVTYRANTTSNFITTEGARSMVIDPNLTTLGVEAGKSLTTGGASVLLGYQAGRAQTTAIGVVAVGPHAGRKITEANGAVAIGYTALNNLTTGNFNIGIGWGGGAGIVSGEYNTAIGQYSLYNEQTGSYNSALSPFALYTQNGADQNIGIGGSAGYRNTTGEDNINIGYYSGFNNIGGKNIIIGTQTGNGVSGSSTYDNSTLLGYKAGYGLTTGDNNILLGFQSGYNLTTGSNNIMLGYNIDAPSNTSSNQLSIGNLIFGTGLDGTGTTLSSGNIGIGTSSPFAKLSINSGGSIALAVATTTGQGEALKLDSNGVMVEKRGVFCEMYSNGGMVTTSVPTTYLTINAFGSTTQAHKTKYCSPNPTTSTITLTNAGTYRVNVSVSFSGTPNSTFIGAIFVDGIENSTVHFSRKLGASGDVGSASASGFITATSTSVVDFRARNGDVGSEDFTIHYGNINVEYIGD